MKKTILYFSNWFFNRSNSFKQIFIDTFNLLGYKNYEIRQLMIEDEFKDDDDNVNLIFFLFIPEIKKFYKNNNYYFVPMYDWFPDWKKEDWEEFGNKHKQFIFLSFSELFNKIFIECNIKHISFKYYCPVHKFSKIKNFNFKSMFYWNRRNSYSVDFIEHICNQFNIDVLYYLEKYDFNQKTLNLPNKFKTTRVEKFVLNVNESTHFLYKYLLNKSNIMLASRLIEGIGVSSLECMSRGGYVIGYNFHSLNEYINHTINGYLLKNNNNYEINNIKDNECLNNIPNMNIDIKKCYDYNIYRCEYGYYKFVNNMKKFIEEYLVD
jgi:hypothetical protein